MRKRLIASLLILASCIQSRADYCNENLYFSSIDTLLSQSPCITAYFMLGEKKGSCQRDKESGETKCTPDTPADNEAIALACMMEAYHRRACNSKRGSCLGGICFPG
jgi:hypothetical protein